MLTSAGKRLVLPFSSPKSRESEVEAAAIYAMAELNRGRGGGLFNRQPNETITFITKIGYPLWIIPKNNLAMVFDGLNIYSHSASYNEPPPAGVFLDNLQTYQRPRETYLAFLCDHSRYFQNPPKTKQLTFQGLIALPDFKVEFSSYRREATELTTFAALLQPVLEEHAITAALTEHDKLIASLAEDEAKLSECLRLMKKTTGQYLTEIDYEATAAKEEAEAKIKAQQEFINPQIAKLTKEYNKRIRDLTASYDKELDDLKRLKTKTEKFVASTESDIAEYEKNAKASARKGHRVYEKRWKEKIKQSEKGLSGLRKELKNTESNIGKVSRQKALDLSKLTQELDAEIKLARQPIAQLEAAREAKIFAYKQEGNRMIACEKPIVEGIELNMQLRESVNRAFDGLGFTDSQLKSPVLVYVSFYAVCYEAGYARRYMCISPSILGGVDFSAKLRGVFGGSKTSNLLLPRFRAIAALISNVETLSRENSAFEGQLWSLGQKGNLLKNSGFKENVKTGLVILRQLDWLSSSQAAEFSRQLTI